MKIEYVVGSLVAVIIVMLVVFAISLTDTAEAARKVAIFEGYREVCNIACAERGEVRRVFIGGYDSTRCECKNLDLVPAMIPYTDSRGK